MTFYELLPIYDRHMFYGDNTKELIRLIHSYYDKDDIDISPIEELEHIKGYAAILSGKGELDNKALAFVMCVHEDSDLGTVAHEANHVTNFIFSYVGQELDINNDEAQSYLVGYLTKQFLEKVRRHESRDRRLKKGDKKRNLER